MRGALVMAGLLIGLQVLVSTPLAQVSAAAALPAKWATQWISPAVPLIPDHRQAAAAAAPARPAKPASTRLPAEQPAPIHFTA